MYHCVHVHVLWETYHFVLQQSVHDVGHHFSRTNIKYNNSKNILKLPKPKGNKVQKQYDTMEQN